MAKRELLYTPLLGQFMYLSKAVFVNRAKREDAVKVFAKVASEMKRKSVSRRGCCSVPPSPELSRETDHLVRGSRQLSLFIFPEGTRSASAVPSLLPFKKGAFHLAVQAQLPIVPIVCENYAHVYHAKSKRFDGGEIVVRGARALFSFLWGGFIAPCLRIGPDAGFTRCVTSPPPRRRQSCRRSRPRA